MIIHSLESLSGSYWRQISTLYIALMNRFEIWKREECRFGSSAAAERIIVQNGHCSNYKGWWRFNPNSKIASTTSRSAFSAALPRRKPTHSQLATMNWPGPKCPSRSRSWSWTKPSTPVRTPGWNWKSSESFATGFCSRPDLRPSFPVSFLFHCAWFVSKLHFWVTVVFCILQRDTANCEGKSYSCTKQIAERHGQLEKVSISNIQMYCVCFLLQRSKAFSFIYIYIKTILILNV